MQIHADGRCSLQQLCDVSDCQGLHRMSKCGRSALTSLATSKMYDVHLSWKVIQLVSTGLPSVPTPTGRLPCRPSLYQTHVFMLTTVLQVASSGHCMTPLAILMAMSEPYCSAVSVGLLHTSRGNCFRQCLHLTASHLLTASRSGRFIEHSLLLVQWCI